MGFMACSRRLDQTGMYLKNEYSVFKGHPDFRPYKVSLTRILRFRVGLVGALWLSLQDYIRFVLTFSVFYTAGLRQKNTPLVSQRGIKDDSILFSINWYPFISWCHLSHGQCIKKATLISANQTSCILLWGYLLFCDTLLWLSPRAEDY